VESDPQRATIQRPPEVERLQRRLPGRSGFRTRREAASLRERAGIQQNYLVAQAAGHGHQLTGRIHCGMVRTATHHGRGDHREIGQVHHGHATRDPGLRAIVVGHEGPGTVGRDSDPGRPRSGQGDASDQPIALHLVLPQGRLAVRHRGVPVLSVRAYRDRVGLVDLVASHLGGDSADDRAVRRIDAENLVREPRGHVQALLGRRIRAVRTVGLRGIGRAARRQRSERPDGDAGVPPQKVVRRTHRPLFRSET
jgi:hypothetical protein